MAADDFSSLTPGWDTQRTAALPNAGTMREILCPTWARRVSVWFYASDDAAAESGKIAKSGTDGAALGNHWIPVSTGGLTWRLATGRARGASASIFVTGSTNAGYAHLLFEGE